MDTQAEAARRRFGIVGNAPALLAAVERAVRVAPIDLSVLVTGESGTGKEFFPQIIHANSPRKHSKYIAVNCGAIPEGTIDSELFGHEKGAFTGAVDSRRGYFEEADGGTIFLDEVAELPLTTQARLLRVLETGEYLRVGSSTVRRTNIRVVAATNVNLLRAVAEGRFREDLYYRLSTVQIHVPPLRERGGDIRLLARKFASDFSERYTVPEIHFTEEAMGEMSRYGWPGNVRQLKNVVEQIALFEAGKDVDGPTLRSYLPADAPESYIPALAGGPDTYSREREALFNMIFRLQERIDELQERISEMDKAKAPATIAAEGGDPARRLLARTCTAHPTMTAAAMSGAPNAHHEVMDATATPVDTASDERESIREALLRNDGRRKATADELGISERTLYRKIREYGLD
ncbi:MAG: sigma 54-interacting transcriptional regulator [Muribaculaceae bacterium]|nr:sigma 54-interacting transcriptional regulator [Muribaculaceae bacterium]